MAKDQPIRPVIKGDTRTLLETAVANELIHLVNKLATAEVKYVTTGASKVEITDDKAYITILLGDTTASRIRNKNNFAQGTGNKTRTTFNPASVTLAQLGERVNALIDDVFYN